MAGSCTQMMLGPSVASVDTRWYAEIFSRVSAIHVSRVSAAAAPVSP